MNPHLSQIGIKREVLRNTRITEAVGRKKDGDKVPSIESPPGNSAITASQNFNLSSLFQYLPSGRFSPMKTILLPLSLLTEACL